MVTAQLVVGARVRIHEQSVYHQVGNLANPVNIHGTIYKIEGSDRMNIKVRWDNGYNNVYDYQDLALTKGLLWT